jgi:hypothetical protein
VWVQHPGNVFALQMGTQPGLQLVICLVVAGGQTSLTAVCVVVFGVYWHPRGINAFKAKQALVLQLHEEQGWTLRSSINEQGGIPLDRSTRGTELQREMAYYINLCTAYPSSW